MEGEPNQRGQAMPCKRGDLLPRVEISKANCVAVLAHHNPAVVLRPEALFGDGMRLDPLAGDEIPHTDRIITQEGRDLLLLADEPHLGHPR